MAAKRSIANNEGQVAFERGKVITSNPYHSIAEKSEYNSWIRGYKSAEKKASKPVKAKKPLSKKKPSSRIISGLKDAVKHAKGDASVGKVHKMMAYNVGGIWKVAEAGSPVATISIPAVTLKKMVLGHLRDAGMIVTENALDARLSYNKTSGALKVHLSITSPSE